MGLLPLEVAITAVVLVCGFLTWKCAYILKPGWRLEVRIGSRPPLVFDKPDLYWIAPIARVKRVRVDRSEVLLPGRP